MSGEGFGPEGSYYEAKAKERAQENERRWDGFYPIFITFVYLVLGFKFHLWHPGWLIFLTVPIYYMKPKNAIDRWLNPVSITLAYLVLGFFFGLWHPAWMLFFLIPMVEIWKHPGKQHEQRDHDHDSRHAQREYDHDCRHAEKERERYERHMEKARERYERHMEKDQDHPEEERETV